MNKLYYSPEAQTDLCDIREYITEELDNSKAAENTLRKILKQIRSLEKHAGLGTPLSSVVGFDTNYRYIVCGNYIAFYYTEDENVYVVRVLYGRRDYLKILFGKLPEED